MPQSIIANEAEHLYAAGPATEAGQRLSAALLRMRRAEQRQEARSLGRSGLSGLDLRALRYLVQADRDGRDLGPKDLVGMLGTSSANVTNVVDRLVKRQLVARVEHPTDRRAHHLRPTEAAFSDVDAIFMRHHAALVSEIDVIDAEEAGAAARVLERLTRALDALD
ncbi:MarR family winged helix-turn-helix transcriptional regulator [Leucobacter chromiiresistens]|uniref:DNA-binding transcriptional regulator, MarR family n=1 Tax=Leucobacter chromiiresistens TaxID=1079994 RepID=A0A1H0YQZ4_9MICO|nr:MarR family transcriptional regulator [Leucobacter chromiiresistens]SDQ17498.1 DNA-binding transcriptional regulator, MarR family [Leucobacter chromiiresistens]